MTQTFHHIPLRTKIIATVTIIALLMFSVLYALTRKDSSHNKVAKNSTAQKMQQFVISISEYAKKTSPGFIIIPQNGVELAFDNADPKREINKQYMDAIDGFGVEELFYFDTLNVDEKRLNALRKLVTKKKILNSDFVTSDDAVDDAKERNKKEGFIPFVRWESNYHYQKIPTRIVNENNNDIYSMAHVNNYLYLINPARYDTKEQFIEAIRKTNFDMVVIDLYYDNDDALTPEDISLLRQKANGGKRLILCYMNIGAAENWRYYWQRGWALNSPSFLKKKYEGYDNEIYVEFWNPQWQKIIYGNDSSYLKKIIDSGFDGAYLDNTEAYFELYKK